MNYAIILAGGAGTRFWPLSRSRLPKQFLRIIEEQSLIEATVRRINRVIAAKHIFLVTNKMYLGQVEKLCNKFAIPAQNCVLEPSARNTLPAIALCAQLIKAKDPLARLVVFPSDHYIKDAPGFKKTITRALEEAKYGQLCLIGIRPKVPSSGYGYIQANKEIRKGIFSLRRFIEKPHPSKARQIFKRKDIFWNSGIFIFQAEALLREAALYAPRIYRKISRIKNKSDIPLAWRGMESASLDYAVLEKSRRLSMVRGDFSWCDLGSWDALYDLLPKDKRNNVILSDCDCLSLNSQRILVCSYEGKRLVAAVGLKDLVIVDTPDALLVCKKEKAQDIKRVVDILKKTRKTCV